jgi:hypothetical protein
MNLEDKDKWQNQIGSAEKMKNKIIGIKELFGFIGVCFLLILFQIWYILTGNE